MSTTHVEPDRRFELVRRYLEDAVAAERSFETQLRNFAGEGDDDEVKALFGAHAEETRLQHQLLAARLEQLGGSPSAGKSLLAHLFALTPKTAQIGHVIEERTTQNLMMGYAVESGEIAMYEALAVIAEAAGDSATAALARQIQAEEKQTADKLWRLIPSRSKIAFNMLTLDETDTAVLTKAVDNRLL